MASLSKHKSDKGKQANMDVLTDLCDKISIENEEELGLGVDHGENAQADEKLKWCIVGRFFYRPSYRLPGH